jgi:type IV fimbrial biogenesis protein FimT
MPDSAAPSRTTRSSGLTALDLLIALSLLAIVLTMAMPAFRELALNQRMKAAIAAMHSSLAFARSAAIEHNAHIVVCPVSTPTRCADQAEWRRGWLVFQDLNDDRELQTQEPLLRRGNPAAQLRILGSASRTRLRFFSNGSAPGSNASLTFCDARGSGSARQITLSASGRIRTRSTQESDGTACEA